VFAKDPIFISANAPFYKQRITRNVGKCLILILGKKAIELIKSKVEDRPIHPDLGGYDAPDKREWKQYVITDDNESIKGKCPFHAQFNEKNII
jgi:hypothetical protein